LNVVRACETAIDLANHVIRVHKLGIPVSSADSFELLKAERVIDSRLAERMRKMVGFRNTVVHQYTKVDISIVEAVIVTELDELLAFADKIREYVNGSSS
ncbi:MAG: type VII toxin-antitoxin system HepT family RNase toxin, partial [Terriglobia bacterium]